jgi:hypothetical protein
MGWATFWAIFSPTHLVTLLPDHNRIVGLHEKSDFSAAFIQLEADCEKRMETGSMLLNLPVFWSLKVAKIRFEK